MTRLSLLLLLSVVGCAETPAKVAQTADAGRNGDGSAEAPTTQGGMDAGAAFDALVFTGPLPACHWPASFDPDAAAGAVPGFSVARTFLACGPSVLDGGGWGSFCSSDISTGCGGQTGEPCVLACEVDQYAVVQIDPYPYEQEGLSPDADIVYATLPEGCVAALGAFTEVFGRTEASSGNPEITCCPCD